jgi:hypothetical protein
MKKIAIYSIFAFSFSVAIGAQGALAGPIFTGDGYFLVDINNAMWKVTAAGNAERVDLPKFSAPEGAAYGNGMWLAWNSGFTVSQDGIRWEPINIKSVSPQNANIATTKGTIYFSGGQFHLTTAINQICSSVNGRDWSCKPAFGSGRAYYQQVKYCGATPFKKTSVDRSTPTGILPETEIVIPDANGGRPGKFFVDDSYTFSACLGQSLVLFSSSFNNKYPFALVGLRPPSVILEEGKGIQEVTAAAGRKNLILMVAGVAGHGHNVLLRFRDKKLAVVKAPFVPFGIAYENGVFLATSASKMYISHNGNSWSLVQ